MKKKWSMVLGVICYTLGIFCSIYVGGWLMLIKPIRGLLLAYTMKTLTFRFLVTSIIKIAFSTTFGGLVWCIGYIGYNFFRGTEDPDWNAIEEKFRAKIAKLEGKPLPEDTEEQNDKKQTDKEIEENK